MELWSNHLSVNSWIDEQRWENFFDKAEHVLGSRLTHLDASDPIRRRETSAKDASQYVCRFKTGEASRWLFGKFESHEISFSIQLNRRIDEWPNSFLWHIPTKHTSIDQAATLFDASNQLLRPFYAFCDDREYVKTKKKPRGAVDLRTELVGVFWRTYFGPAYVRYFGEKKLEVFPTRKYEPTGGVTIELGDSPAVIPRLLRDRFEQALGKRSFVDTADHGGKTPGEFALTFEELLRVEAR